MAGPASLVVDASVAVKWFNPEEDREAAILLRDEHARGKVRISAPLLLMWEVANGLRYSAEAGTDFVQQALRDLWDLGIAFHAPDPEWMAEAVSIALERGLTIYDASYPALARHLGTLCYAADDKMIEKAPPGLVRHISTYGVGP